MTEKSKVPTTFTYSEVLEETLKYFRGDELAATTWINKYAMKTKEGQFSEKTPDDMHRRMSKEFGSVELMWSRDDGITQIKHGEKLSQYGRERRLLTREKIYQLFKDFKYAIPQGSVMSSLGNSDMMASLSNCVVVPPVYDSYGGIFHTDQQLAQLFKRRCGVGVDLSNLRPSGSFVKNSSGSTTGAVSFMHRFSNTTREVAQNGRRGALMLTMDIAHPDIEEFVTIKQDLTKVTGANISLRLSDEFMKAVVEDEDFTLRFPIDSKEPIYTKVIRAKELWGTIIECAHNTAEPGLIFWDRQHKYSTSSIYPGYKNDSTNPCSEIAMQGGDSCRLIAINLYSFVENPFTDKASFNYSKFYEVVYESQRLMDDLVDLELRAVASIMRKICSDKEPEEIKRTELSIWELLYRSGREGRRTGLGFTALADTLAALDKKFDGDEALLVVDEIMKTKLRGEFDSSIDMAVVRGQFKGFDPLYENQSEFIKMMEREFPDIYKRMMVYGRRNISISTVAPTGSLSMLAQTSSGIEPVYLLSYKRRRKVNREDKNANIDFTDNTGDSFEEFEVVHPKLEDWKQITGKTDTNESPYAGSTASEINWKKRVELQSLVQKYTTHSISSTINLPKDVPVSLVGDIYIESWKRGLKGITVYRDGSRSGILVASDSQEKEVFKEKELLKRPEEVDGMAYVTSVKGTEFSIFVGTIEDKPYEVFGYTGTTLTGQGIITRRDRGEYYFKKTNGAKHNHRILTDKMTDEQTAICRLISVSLSHGVPLVRIVDQLEKSKSDMFSFTAAIGRILKTYIVNGSQSTVLCTNPDCTGDRTNVIFLEGCSKCLDCGSSKCG